MITTDLIHIFSNYSPYYLTCIKTPEFTQRKLMKGISKLDNVFKKYIFFYPEKKSLLGNTVVAVKIVSLTCIKVIQVSSRDF